jgi:hypothetical protein
METFIPVLSMLLLLSMMLRDVTKHHYLVVLNPFFWTSLLFFFYLILPSFFVEEINHFFSWGIDRNSIITSHIITLLSVMMISFFYFFNGSGFSFKQDQIYKAGIVLKFLWLFVFLYLLFAFSMKVKSFNVVDAFMYNHTQDDPYKIKNLAYLLLTLSTLCFLSEKKYWIFIPNLLIVVLDLLNGSRTTALIALMPIIVCLCVEKRTLFIIPGTIMLSGMLLLGVIRSDNVLGGVPWYLNAIGEFRETYITLPLLVLDDIYVGQGDFFEAVATVGVGILQPLRTEIFENFTFSGVYIYNLVSRGYGLGSNFIIESFYYGYVGFIILLLNCCLMLTAVRYLITRSTLTVAIVISCFAVVFLRILIREGFPASFGLFVFVFLFYSLPIIMLDRVKSVK